MGRKRKSIKQRARSLGRRHFREECWRGNLVARLCSTAVAAAYEAGYDAAREQAAWRYPGNSGGSWGGRF